MSFKLRTPCFSTLLLALATGMAANAQAASPSVLTSMASLSNVQIELIDLNPNDGIAPALTFNGQGVLAAQLINYDTGTYDGPGYANGNFLPNQEVRYDTADVTNVATGSSLSVANHLTWDRVATKLTDTPGGNGSMSNVFLSNSAGLFYYEPGCGSIDLPFTLTANTALVIRGTMSASASLQGGAISQALQESGYTGGWSPSRSGYLGASVSLSSWHDYIDGQDRAVGSYFSRSEANVYLSPDLLVSNDQLISGDSTASDFVVNFSNFDSISRMGSVTLTVQATDDLTLMTVQAIPEPSTYALMGLGLVGMMWARRRVAR